MDFVLWVCIRCWVLLDGLWMDGWMDPSELIDGYMYV